MRVKDRNNIENNFWKRIKQSIKNLFRRNDANYHSNQRKFSVNLRSYYEEYPEFKVTGGEIRIECVNKTYKVLTTIGNVPKFETIIIPGQSQVMSYEEYEELKRIMNVVLSEEEKEQIRILWDNLDILYENSNGEYNDEIRNIQEEIAKLVSEIYPEIDKTVTLSEEEMLYVSGQKTSKLTVYDSDIWNGEVTFVIGAKVEVKVDKQKELKEFGKIIQDRLGKTATIDFYDGLIHVTVNASQEEELEKIFYEYGLMKQPPQKRRK